MRPVFTLIFLLASLILLPSCHHKLHKLQREAAHAANGKKKFTTDEYVTVYHKIAVYQMKKDGIPASIILAQGILESSNGNSTLARYANNHFGIKCTSEWHGKTYTMDDDRKNECFRRYKSVADSYKDHSDFLKRKRYANLFQLDTDDYKGWAHGLKKAGYATNPKYPQLLINLIEKYKLYRFDN